MTKAALPAPCLIFKHTRQGKDAVELPPPWSRWHQSYLTPNPAPMRLMAATKFGTVSVVVACRSCGVQLWIISTWKATRLSSTSE